MKNKGKTINSEGCLEGEARGTSRGIYRLSRVFHIRLLFSLDLQGQEFVFFPRITGKEFVFFPC